MFDCQECSKITHGVLVSSNQRVRIEMRDCDNERGNLTYGDGSNIWEWQSSLRLVWSFRPPWVPLFATKWNLTHTVRYHPIKQVILYHRHVPNLQQATNIHWHALEHHTVGIFRTMRIQKANRETSLAKPELLHETHLGSEPESFYLFPTWWIIPRLYPQL